jgi:hypothetical protein
MDTTLAKEKHGDRNLFAIEKVHGIEMCIGTKFQKKPTILTHLLRSKSCSMLIS